jgi:enoyl-CoA hydratase/carnithine racemase
MTNALGAALADLQALAVMAPPSSGRITLDFDKDLAWVRIDNARARNAMTVSMMVDLARVVLALREWEGRAVIVGSAVPGVFCSGGHLDEVQKFLLDPENGRRMSRAMATVLDGLLDTPALVVAAIEGAAVGGGAEVATAADFRVVRAEARINFVHTRLGVIPGWGGTARLVRLLGRSRALRVLAEARALAPDEAQALGLVDLVADTTAADGALSLLAPLRTVPIAALRAVKGQVVAAHDAEAQADRFAEVWGGIDHRTALAGLLGGSRTR